MTPLWGQVIVGAASGVGGLLGGVAAMAKARPEKRKADAEADQADAEVHLQLQKATTEAIKNVRAAAEESIRSAHDQANRAVAEMSILQKRMDQVVAQASEVEQRLKVTNEELINTRRENDQLRTSMAAERAQLLAQMATERAEHQAAIQQLKSQIQQLRVAAAAAPGPTGVVLNPDDFETPGQG